MIEIGKYNTLRVVKVVDFGVYLDGEERGEILLPNEYVPKDCFPDDYLKVFIYFDSEDRIIATTEVPNIKVGEFAWMKVVATSSVGAFMDWGLRKDLLVPFREQRDRMVASAPCPRVFRHIHSYRECNSCARRDRIRIK